MKRTRIAAALALSGLALAACGQNTGNPTSEENKAGESAVASPTKERNPEEASGPTPRLVATYDGGILTLDADSLEVIDDTKLEGFNRLNPAGDGRTVLVSTSDGFRAFDTGVWTEPHGDHTHSYQMPPLLTDTTYEAKKPGHVVPHDGRTLLFGDGDGSIQELDVSDLKRAYQHNKLAKAKEIAEVTPHHGVAVALPDGGMIHTMGTEDERHTVVAKDKDGQEIAKAENCPGVHGEAVAADGVVLVGCQDGVLIFTGAHDHGDHSHPAEFRKVTSPDSYGRIGNQAGHEDSPVVLGDYKVKKDPEKVENPTRVSLTNTKTGELKLVDVEASYSFRSLGRGPNGEALVLGDDGKLRVIDPESGEVTGAYPVTKAWKEPEEWQEARPTLFVQGDVAYVTEPAAKKIHAVDIATGHVIKSVDTPESLNELTGVKG
ncbi:MAG TPA: hypothetical protein H9867_02660 [Candidatus Corynebacterium gallistercoris]|uniref:Secreted protein n=1 Tax=Candidatus Corynebacterium gallistercoris TaxID=2838530 RepID=A0A9D1RXE3_9CORY|nr:hypothetical protein [Candidatus Corynebacterium gallistercoris]